MEQSNLLTLQGVGKSFDSPDGKGQSTILQGVDLSVQTGDSLAIMGPSGSGKTTLLNLIGGLDLPTSGTVLLQGQDLAQMNEKEISQVRARQIGLVFQFHHLLPQCTVLENVLLPTLVTGKQARARGEALLENVGLADHRDHRPAQLSGGQRQRVALIRALINEPSLLLADEPTGALDQRSAKELVDLLLQINAEQQVALIVVSHAPSVAQRMRRQYLLQEGQLTPRETGR